MNAKHFLPLNSALKAQVSIVEATPAELVKASHIYNWKVNGKPTASGALTFRLFNYPKDSFVVIRFSVGARGGVTINSVVVVSKAVEKSVEISKSKPIRVYAHATIEKIINEGPLEVYRIEGIYSEHNRDYVPTLGESAAGKFASISPVHQRRNLKIALKLRTGALSGYVLQHQTAESLPNWMRYVYETTIFAEEYRPPLMRETSMHYEYTDGSEIVVEKGIYTDIIVHDVFRYGKKRKWFSGEVIAIVNGYKY